MKSDLKVLFVLIILPFVNLNGQTVGFERDILSSSALNSNGFFSTSLEQNGSIYSNFDVDCATSDEYCFTEIHKYSKAGDLVWSQQLDSIFISFDALTIEEDKIYALGKYENFTEDNYFKLITLDTFGTILNSIQLGLNNEYYQNQIVTNINYIHNHLFITGYGYALNINRFVAFVKVITETGEEKYFRPWDQVALGYNKTIFWEVIEKQGNDSLVYLSGSENDGIISEFLPSKRKSLYSLDFEKNIIDTIFHTDSWRTTIGAPSFFAFNQIGNVIYSDSNSEFASSRGLEVGEIEYGGTSYEDALWITRIRDWDFQDEHNILSQRYGPLNLTVTEEDDIYVSGLMDFSRIDEKIWWNAACYITKFSSTGEFLWQKIYVEIGSGTANNKVQHIYSLDQLPDNSLIGLGVSVDPTEDSYIRKGWMLKINEYGCLDGSEDCPYLIFLDDINQTMNSKLESLNLKIGPNPVTSLSNINFEKKTSGILKLLDTQGNLIKEIDIKSQSHFQMDTSFLTNGVYVLLFFPDNNSSQIYSSMLYKN